MSGTPSPAVPSPTPAAAPAPAPAPSPSGEQPGASTATQPSGEQNTVQSPSPSPAPQEPAWVKPRIDRLTFERREAERQAEALRAENERLASLVRAAGGQPSAPPAPAPASAASRADIERQVQERFEAERFNETCNKVWNDACATDQAFATDYKKMCESVGAPSNDLLQQIVGDSDATQVLSHFARNLDDAARIFALPLVQQVRELERLRVKIQGAPRAPAVSGAPAPISTTDGAHAPPGNTGDYEAMTVDEFMRVRNQKSRRRS